MERLDRALKIRDTIINSESAERCWDDETGMRRLNIKTIRHAAQAEIVNVNCSQLSFFVFNSISRS